MTSEIVSRIWEGRIPVRIGLSARDSQQGLAPSVFYCGTLRRNGYIHVVLPLLLRFFAPFVEDSSALKRDDWWLEFEDVPVKWNWPIGVSFDVMTGFDPSNAEPEPQAWELTLHHKDYPAEYIVPILTPPPSVRNQFLEDYWINQMKEACFILTGSAKPIMNLSRANSANFWKSVENHDPRSFTSIHHRLIPKLSIRQIPIRIYTPVANNVIQPIVAPVNMKTGALLTLGEALQQCVPELFPTSLMYTVAYPVSHGVILPLSVPLEELYEPLVYIDGFLHVSVVMKPST